MRQRDLIAASLCAAVATAFAGTVAWAAIPGDGGMIQGCYDAGGNLKVVAAVPCPKGYTQLPWNQQGIQGPEGDKGDPGPPGPQGAPGPAATPNQCQRTPAGPPLHEIDVGGCTVVRIDPGSGGDFSLLIGDQGQVVTLIASSAVTAVDVEGCGLHIACSNMQLAGDDAMGSGDSLQLAKLDSFWHEVGRSDN